MSGGARDRLCILAAVGVLVLGIATWAQGRPSIGLTFASDGSRLVVGAVEPGSIAWSAGVRPGMVLQQVDSRDPVPPVGTDLAGHELDLADPGGGWSIHVWPFVVAHGLVLPALWAALALLVGAFVVRRRLRGVFLVDTFAAPLLLAAVAPLALVPSAVFGSPTTLLVGAVTWPLAAWPLAAAIGQQSATPATSGRLRSLVNGSLALTLALVPLLYLVPGPATPVVVAREALVVLALLGPIALASRAGRADDRWLSSIREQRAAAIVGLALVPLLLRLTTVATIDAAALVFAALWIAAGAFVIWFLVFPLFRFASGALQQRNLVAAATDTERRHMAADLHDGPLQSLTLLAYRLDALGDAENAAFARDVVTELRAVTSALRLPVVDDLGAGQALEWLTQRMGTLAGNAIELERAESARPPRDVEHAVFRIAQEALANATRHGRPPIRVRYEAGAGHASLIVDDAGDGMPSANDADQAGLGLAGMRERANAVGGELQISAASGGTRVRLVWPAGAS